ncbi:MAG: hypothetical protein WBP26_03685 [Candidatus Saccharimonadales bacterium]
MYVTNKLKVFIGLCIIYSTLAGFALVRLLWPESGHTGYQVGPGKQDALLFVVYLTLMVASGYLLARTDGKREYRKSIMLHYHFVGALALSVVAGLCWLALEYFGWRYAAWFLLVGWGSFGLHWLSAHNKTKGIAARSAFK